MKKIFLIVFILVIIGAYTISEENIIIPTSSIRLRVIPNSNSAEDIYMKEKVKKYLEQNIYTITKDITNIDEVRKLINENIPSIDGSINRIFKENKYPFSYNVNYGYNYFPEKIYKGIIYKEGYYESLVISIGSAEGDNWWCVLFPNFCLTDLKDDREYKSYFKEVISKYSKNKKAE